MIITVLVKFVINLSKLSSICILREREMDDFFDEYSNKHVNSSPKKKHKTKANGFLLFMLEFRRKEAAKGNEMDMNEVQIEAGVIWNVTELRFFSFRN